MRTIEVDRGRLITQVDCDEARRVVVIGTEASKQLFADRDPVGSTLSLNGLPYTVIGRVRKKDQDSNYTGPTTNGSSFPTNRRERTSRSPAATAPRTPFRRSSPRRTRTVTEEMKRWVEREGIGGFIGLEAQGPGGAGRARRAGAARTASIRSDPRRSRCGTPRIPAVMFGKMIAGMHTFFVAVSLITLTLGGIGVMNIMTHGREGADEGDRRPQGDRRDVAHGAVAVLQRGLWC